MVLLTDGKRVNMDWISVITMLVGIPGGYFGLVVGWRLWFIAEKKLAKMSVIEVFFARVMGGFFSL